MGALDGCHFKQHNPGVAVEDPNAYFVPCKDEFALLATAVCDARRRFTFWEFNVTPTTHDSLAWASSELGMEIAAGELPEEYFINGDNAYVLSNQMIVPCGSAKFSDFDFQQSSNRIYIEVR